jgi:hypothetical protein
MGELIVSDLLGVSLGGMDVQKIFAEAQTLDLAEQDWLADAMREHVNQQKGISAFTPEQCEEIDRRVAYCKAHPETLIPGEEVMARLRQKLSD